MYCYYNSKMSSLTWKWSGILGKGAACFIAWTYNLSCMLLPDDLVSASDFNEPFFVTCTVISGLAVGCSYH